MADDEKRTQGPELGCQERLDIVEDSPGMYHLEVTIRHDREGGDYVTDSLPIGGPLKAQGLSRVIRHFFRAFRKATKHERVAARHQLVEEIVEETSDREPDGDAPALEPAQPDPGDAMAVRLRVALGDLDEPTDEEPAP